MPHEHFKTAERHAKDCYVGTCPACGEHVLWDEPDGPVWTCPADLSPQNPYWEPASDLITESMREQAGIYSNCGEDFGFVSCYDRMPLHSLCYERGGY